MKKKTYKIIICISLVVMLFTNFTSVFGATNPYYIPETNVSENALDTKIKDSVLLDVLANMINAVASLVEYLIGAVFQSLTGDNIFPWADRIIFNGIGFLDINFLNAATNSLFVSNGSDSILGKVVKNVYSTIFSLAVLFLGVAIGVMAIRLAISSIAAEKAKYKQAIVNWLTCMVLLFLMHYILAFVFWINEQMVQIASGILINAIEESGLNTVNFQEALDTVVSPEDRVNSYIESYTSWKIKLADYFSDGEISRIGDYIRNNSEIANNFLKGNYVDDRMVYYETNTGENLGTEIGATKEMACFIGSTRLAVDVIAAADIQSKIEVNEDDTKAEKKRKQEYKETANKTGYYDCGGSKGKVFINNENGRKAYKESEEYFKDLRAATYVAFASGFDIYTYYVEHPEINVCVEKNPNVWTATLGLAEKNAQDILGISTKKITELEFNRSNLKLLENLLGSANVNKIINIRLKNDAYIISAASGSVTSSTTDIIANLGAFFKQSAYVYTTEEVTDDRGEKSEVLTGWRASKVSVTGALLYAIFIFQSCMYLIMYVKRLFYVMMLSMFGPIVVIYDFFVKSAS